MTPTLLLLVCSGPDAVAIVESLAPVAPRTSRRDRSLMSDIDRDGRFPFVGRCACADPPLPYSSGGSR